MAVHFWEKCGKNVNYCMYDTRNMKIVGWLNKWTWPWKINVDLRKTENFLIFCKRIYTKSV